jgi:hypothetical protein
MVENRLKFARAFSISFRKLERWDVAFFRDIQWKWPDAILKRLGSFLSRVKAPIDCYPEAAPIIEKITFGGELSIISKSKRKGYKGKLFRAEPGQLIYSKIRVKQGSICIVPESHEWVAVSSEYPIYSLNRLKVVPTYLELVLRSSAFKHYLDGLSHGGSTKTRIAPEEFERLRIPLPPLTVQQSIVEHLQRAEKKLAFCKAKQKNSVAELNYILQQKTNSCFGMKKTRFFVADYSKASQWDVKSGRSAAFRKLNPEFVRMGDFAEECAELVKPWEEPEKEWPIYGVNNQVGIFFNCYQKGKAFSASYKKIKKGWFFHNPTRANVGSLGMVPEVPIDAITSPEYQVWQLKGGFLPEFMDLMIRTEYFLTLIDFSRVGAVKQRMYYANLAEIRLPLLEYDVQLRFADEWKTDLTELSKAERNLKIAQAEIEEMILGIRPAGGVQDAPPQDADGKHVEDNHSLDSSEYLYDEPDLEEMVRHKYQ